MPPLSSTALRRARLDSQPMRCSLSKVNRTPRPSNAILGLRQLASPVNTECEVGGSDVRVAPDAVGVLHYTEDCPVRGREIRARLDFVVGAGFAGHTKFEGAIGLKANRIQHEFDQRSDADGHIGRAAGAFIVSGNSSE